MMPFNLMASYNNIDSKIANIYELFYNKVEKKYTNDKWLDFLIELDKAINSIQKNKKLSTSSYEKIFDLEKLNNQKIFELEFKNIQKIWQEKINTNDLFKSFPNKSYNKHILSLENWIWYSYDYKKSYYFNNNDKVSYNDLIKNWINPETDLIIYWENWISFVNEFSKFKIVTDDIIYWLPNKLEVINFLKKSNRHLRKDIDSDLKKIKDISTSINSNQTKHNEIIKNTYAYILENVSYSNNFNLDDYEIYSWVETFNNKNWVCEWYVELFSLMLAFNWIKSEIIKWDVIDANDFPNIGHAWVKIDKYYYDITFDDPIWNTEAKKLEEYEYYKLPKDLFYTNRYDFWNTPDDLKSTSINYRKKLINENLTSLVFKYKDSNYNLLKPIIFKKENSIDTNKIIEVSDILKIYDYYRFEDYKIYFENEIKEVQSLSYTLLEDNSINTLLKERNYDLSKYTILEWINNWKKEYIIINDITYR